MKYIGYPGYKSVFLCGERLTNVSVQFKDSKGRGMQIVKVINNNVVSAFDEKEKEVVVMGRGLAFGKKAGDQIDEDKIAKVFSISEDKASQYLEIVKDMPYDHIRVANLVISYAKEKLACKLSRNIYITLTDHLSYAIERSKQGVVFSNAFLWEIKKFYSSEYQVGIKALAIVETELGVTLSEDEAGFIALHLVNARIGGEIKQSMEITGIIKDVLSIIKYTFQIEIDENSLAYEHFLVHLKFFIQRAVKGEYYDGDDSEFNQMMQVNFPKVYECALRIQDYMHQRLQYNMSQEELAYIAVHINRIIHSKMDNESVIDGLEELDERDVIQK